MWIDTTLKGTHNHYVSYLPENAGFVSSGLLKFLFSRIKMNMDPETVNEISGDKIVVYAGKYKSYFEYLLYFSKFRKKGLPFPEIGFEYNAFLFQPMSRILRIILSHMDFLVNNLALPCPYKSGYYQKELVNGRSGFLSLIERKYFFRRFFKPGPDPVQHLIEMQETIDKTVLIVPMLIFFSKVPEKSEPGISDVLFGTSERPGRRKRLLTLFNNPQKIFADMSEPVNLKQFLESPEIQKLNVIQKSLALRRLLLDRINRHRHSITGPVLKNREELKENILNDAQLHQYIEQHSKKRDIPIYQERYKAEEYIDEIAANYNTNLIKFAAVIVRWIMNTMFDGIDVNNDEVRMVKNVSRKGPLILVPCHKSHIDYLIISYIFFINNMPCPHIVAGKNLSFWPIGALFRNGGAFFIRRTFSGAVLYSKVFSAYVQTLLKEGFNIELFFEGTRSRTGKLITPQLGFISMLLNAYKNQACDDMIFIPIHIGYDRVIEESSFLHEVEGGQKKPENLRNIVKAGRFLKNRYGKIYLKFNTPISLKEYLDQKGYDPAKMTSKQQNNICHDLGDRIANGINEVSVVTPNALVASAVLNISKEKFSYDHILSMVETYMTCLYFQKARMADTMHNHFHAVKNVLDTYLRRKLIESPDVEETDFSAKMFHINENKRQSLEYYKNNCIIFFIPAAFTALSILEKDSFLFSASDLHGGYSFLTGFFINEFTHDVEKTSEFNVRKNLKAFINDGILVPHQTLPDTYNLTSAGLRKLKLFASFLKTYFESYLIVLNFFMKYSQNSVKAKNRPNKIQSIGERMFKKKKIHRKEALSKIYFKNAETFFIRNGIRGSGDDEKIKFYSQAINRYLNCLL